MAIPALEIEITADTKAAEVGFAKVERSLDGLEKATNDYRNALNKINAAEKRGVITSTQAAKAIRGAEVAYEQAARAAASYSGAAVTMHRTTAEVTRGFRGLSSGSIQNASFQIGDFATQVGAGTSASIALGQQLPQLLGAFGMYGAVAGAVAAVGIPLAASFFRAGDGAKSAEDATEDFVATLEAFAEVSKAAGGSLTALNEQFGRTDQIARSAAEALAEIGARKLKDDFDSLTNSLISGGDQMLLMVRAFDAAAGGSLEASRTFRQMPPAVQDAIRALDAFETQGTDDLEALRDSAGAALDALTSLDDPKYDGLIGELGKIISALGKVENKAVQTGATLRRSIYMGPESGGRGADPRQFDTDNRLSGAFVPSQDIIDRANDLLNPSAATTGGGSGGSSQPDRIGALAKSLMDQTEVVENWRAESLEALQDFNALELDVLGGHAEAKARIEEEYQKRLTDIQDKERRSRVQAISGALGDVATLMKSENEKLFNIGKAASMANAIVNGYEAATEAWAKGMAIGGPPVAAAFTAASLARTGALVSSIASQSVSRGSSGGGGGGAGSAAGVGGGTQTALAVDLNVRGRGDLATDPAAVDSFTDMLLDNFRDRGITVVRA